MGRVRRTLWIGLLALALGAAAPLAANAAERVALVIGNDSYQRAPALRNARNDARAMAALLGNLGFRLVGDGPQLDVDRRSLARLVRDFGNRIGPGDVALFYFAGHGIAGIAQQTNWLIPVDDGAIEIQEDVPDFSVGLHSVLRRMEARGSGINLVFLDACRNNPLPDRRRSAGGTRGLARIDAPIGSFIAYAAAPGEAALDGDGANGLFTGALIDAMKTPGLRIEDVLIRTTQTVREASSGRQVPWRESSLEQAFYLVPPGATERPAQPAGPPDADEPAPARPAAAGTAAEVTFWSSIQGSDDPRVFEEYLKRYPDGTFSGLARIRLESLSQSEDEEQMAALPPPQETPAAEPGPEIDEVDLAYVAVKRANVRAGPSTDFGKVARLEVGQDVTVTGKVAGKDWLRIALADGGEGFVFGPLLTDAAAYAAERERKRQQAKPEPPEPAPTQTATAVPTAPKEAPQDVGLDPGLRGEVREAVARARRTAQQARNAAVTAQGHARQAVQAAQRAKAAAEKARRGAAGHHAGEISGDRRYEGEVRNDLASGVGVTIFGAGDRYEGEFEAGNASGHGIITLANGWRYQSQTRNNSANGYGVFTGPDGFRYEGQITNGVPQGLGVGDRPDGTHYEGEYQNNTLAGFGIYRIAGGRRYEGRLQNNLPDGLGATFHPDGSLEQQGFWQASQLVKPY